MEGAIRQICRLSPGLAYPPQWHAPFDLSQGMWPIPPPAHLHEIPGPQLPPPVAGDVPIKTGPARRPYMGFLVFCEGFGSIGLLVGGSSVFTFGGNFST